MNIYFSGIGGVAIGPLSEIALDAGYDVQGSDKNSSLVTKRLEERGIPLSIGEQDGSFLQEQHDKKPIDWFIYTSALPADHPELVLAGKLGIKTAKRDELIARIIAEKNLKLIAVAGTHGKTTTTGMLIWALEQQGYPISYSIGTTINFGPSGLYNPSSEYFIYECDEFDRNFLHFHPYFSLITSIDYDHPDTYPTEADYQSAFRQFIYQSEQALLWQRDADYIKSRYPQARTLLDDEVRSLSIPGEHNRRNASLVLRILELLGLGESTENFHILEYFPGTDRRFEKLADNLYSDYGHHPTEIVATLQMARELSDHVILVYQPHQNTRQHQIRDDYKDAFLAAEKIYWLPTYLSRENPSLSVLTPEELSNGLTNSSAVEVAELNDDLWQTITDARKQDKLVLLMGAGNIDAWVREQLQRNK
jgi:UDP-N-acetylmuramate--alanine ligase